MNRSIWEIKAEFRTRVIAFSKEEAEEELQLETWEVKKCN